ncbi:hypothetical protein PIROE2DRAFT_12142 [Piromyces sp. E2]|nr:hypothetical protein PIROE2DRAFT_12142 [Piromyces sp. E2]|eukprot:OUM61784.1 hypothetical protein PIROE2DRAFT_12142 [Piromyces sp. E2]
MEKRITANTINYVKVLNEEILEKIFSKLLESTIGSLLIRIICWNIPILMKNVLSIRGGLTAEEDTVVLVDMTLDFLMKKKNNEYILIEVKSL